jgi:hypothetical protein
MSVKESLKWNTFWKVYKFKDPDGTLAKQLKKGLKISEIPPSFLLKLEECQGNISLNEGIQEAFDIIAGLGTPTKWDNAHAYLGVGDSNAATDPAQTDLQAVTNKVYVAVDATYPQRTAQTLEYRATFAAGNASFSWQEYTLSNTSSGTGKNLNRALADKGTKAAGETWTLVLQIVGS